MTRIVEREHAVDDDNDDDDTLTFMRASNNSKWTSCASEISFIRCTMPLKKTMKHGTEAKRAIVQNVIRATTWQCLESSNDTRRSYARDRILVDIIELSRGIFWRRNYSLKGKARINKCYAWYCIRAYVTKKRLPQSRIK
ncbi:hypothetical protein OS493_016938 [Desmophyllum pertusum]|uniref:Uncharacterized protein n=1 Tax=Desmophyllum pertusum TaxID=174260 RepID=A0A9X0CKP6_9CNID|nr:hypothetical protein OS493_016938 [Desmophyllum pertusum]